jgi:hypothetical protein
MQVSGYTNIQPDIYEIKKFEKLIQEESKRVQPSSPNHTTSTLIISSPHRQASLQNAANSIVGRLSLETSIKHQRAVLGAPAVLIANAPNRNTNTVLDIQTSLDNRLVITRARTRNIELRDGALLGDSAQRGKCGLDASGLAGAQVGLGADAVDGDAGGGPGFDLGGHAFGFAVRGAVEVVVVDVEFCGGVGGLGGFEGELDEGFAEDVVEDGGAEGAVFGEDLVDDVLVRVSFVLLWDGMLGERGGDIPMRRPCPCTGR